MSERQGPKIDLPKKIGKQLLLYAAVLLLTFLLVAFVAKSASPYWKIIWGESWDTTMAEAVEKFGFTALVFFCLLLLKHFKEGRNGVMIHIKDALFSIFSTVLASIIFFCAHFYLVSPAKRDAQQNKLLATSSSQPKISFDILTNKLAKVENESQREKTRADEAERKIDGYSAIVKASLNPSGQEPISQSINEFRIKLDQEWQKTRTNGVKDPKKLSQDIAELVKHNMEQGELSKLATHAKMVESIKRVYPIWSATASKFKDELSVSAKPLGREVLGGAVPPISEIISNEVINTFITFSTNSSWKCRLEFMQSGYFNLDCQENGKVRGFLSINSSGGGLSISLRHIQSGNDIMMFSTNYPISSLENCVGSLDTALRILIQDQEDQF